MIGQSQFRAILYASAIVSALLLLLTWVALPASAPTTGEGTDAVGQSLQIVYKAFSTLISVATLAFVGFDKLAWRWPLVRFLTKATPDLQGTWKGEIISTWIDPGTNEAPAPIEAYLVARQTWSTLSLRLYTKESQSKLLTGGFIPDPDSTCTVSGIYQNEPVLLRRDVSPIHYGAILLQVCGTGPLSLTGHYWTDRKTTGQLRFSAKSGTMHFSFESASKEVYQ